MQILDPSGYPMMAKEEVAIINKLLREHQCKRCLEWGSGNSTIWFPKENPFIEKWLAVEHNETYLELLGGNLKRGVASIDILPDKSDYIKAPILFGINFDFILIDGKWRSECVDMALEVSNKETIILLHDCGWEELDLVMQKYKDRVKILTKGEKQLSNGFYNHRGLALFKI